MAKEKSPTRGRGQRKGFERTTTVEPETVESRDVQMTDVEDKEVSASEAEKTISTQFGGEKMAERMKEGFESVADLFGFEGARKAAAFYIDTSEKLAREALDFEAKAAEWAKDTPFKPLLDAQASIGRKFVELSASAARKLWQIEEKGME